MTFPPVSNQPPFRVEECQINAVALHESSSQHINATSRPNRLTVGRSDVLTSSFAPAVCPTATNVNAVTVDQGTLHRARGYSNIGGVVGRV